MTNSDPRRKRHPFPFDDSKLTRRWYHYALRRLPLSLFNSFLVVIFGVPLLVWLAFTIYDWFAG